MDDRTVSTRKRPEEVAQDAALRPKLLAEMIGQDPLRNNLQILLDAARLRGEALDHVLLYGPPGLGKCITADSLILTDIGWRSFNSFIPVDLQPDTAAPCESPVYGLQGIEPTSHVFASGFGRTRRIITQAGFEIEGTPNHAILVATSTGPQWKCLDAISSDDYVAIGREMNQWGKRQTASWRPDSSSIRRAWTDFKVNLLHDELTQELGRPPSAIELRQAYVGAPTRNSRPELSAKRLGLTLTDGRSVVVETAPWRLTSEIVDRRTKTIDLDADLAYLMGTLVGDGHFEQGSNSPSFVITCSEVEIQSELQRIALKLFSQVPRVRHYGDRAPSLRFSQTQGQMMLDLGVKAELASNKVIPSSVLSGERSVAIGFLQGLFDADGNVWPDGYVEYGSRSKQLVQQVQLLLANLGIIARRSKKTVNSTDFWKLFIGGFDAERFHDIVGFRLKS